LCKRNDVFSEVIECLFEISSGILALDEHRVQIFSYIFRSV
jgi:hypothetical protein